VSKKETLKVKPTYRNEYQRNAVRAIVRSLLEIEDQIDCTAITRETLSLAIAAYTSLRDPEDNPDSDFNY
jgi:hypothetical protein